MASTILADVFLGNKYGARAGIEFESYHVEFVSTNLQPFTDVTKFRVKNFPLRLKRNSEPGHDIFRIGHLQLLYAHNTRRRGNDFRSGNDAARRLSGSFAAGRPAHREC